MLASLQIQPENKIPSTAYSNGKIRPTLLINPHLQGKVIFINWP